MRPLKFSAADPWIFTKKTPFMQRIGDYARGGFSQYIQGKCSLKKLPNLTQKLADRYKINMAKITQVRHKKEGKNVYIWLGYVDKEGIVYWVLLLHEGTEKDTTDSWKNLSEDRIQITGYELVKLPRAKSKNAALTWRYTRQRYDDIRNEIVDSIRNRRDDELKQIIYSLWRSPGFAAVRDQVKKTRILMIKEWQRTRSKNEEMPPIPRQIGFARRIEDVGDFWSILVERK